MVEKKSLASLANTSFMFIPCQLCEGGREHERSRLCPPPACFRRPQQRYQIPAGVVEAPDRGSSVPGYTVTPAGRLTDATSIAPQFRRGTDPPDAAYASWGRFNRGARNA